MFFNFKFRHFLTNPHNLAEQLKSSTMRGFNVRVLFVFLLGIVLFATRELWGMDTEAITPLVSTMTTADYALARFASLAGVLIWALLYMSFHFFGFAYILTQVTEIPFKKLLPLQLLMTSLLLMEKALIFLVFAMKGVTTNVSFLSFGPLAATFMEIPFFIFFFNQLTVTTAIIITLQYKFILSYTGLEERKKVLWILIGIHVLLALVVAAFGFIPVEGLFEYFTGGGGK